MSLKEECTVLRRVPMFQTMDDSQLKLLSFASERVNFMPGEAFIREGDMADHAYVVLSGTVDILIEANGAEHKVNQVGANSLIGEIALLHDSPRTATVRAHDRVTCLKLSRDVFFHLARSSPDFSTAVMRELAIRLERATAQIRTMLNRAPQPAA